MKKTTLFSLSITIAHLQSLAEKIIAHVQRKEQKTLVPLTMNEVIFSSKNILFQQKLQHFDFLTPDGMPLVWLIKLRGENTERLYGPDIMLTIMELGQANNIRHFLYGSTPTVLRTLTAHLRKKFPKIKLAGSYSPPFRRLTPTEKAKLLTLFKKSRPDIIWVGLGGQKQVFWIDEWKKKLPKTNFIAVGAAFDFLSGQKRQAPQWIRVLGLEWFFRLLQEPRRLWKRYVIQFPSAVYLFLTELFRPYEKS